MPKPYKSSVTGPHVQNWLPLSQLPKTEEHRVIVRLKDGREMATRIRLSPLTNTHQLCLAEGVTLDAVTGWRFRK